ncbi:uncharacterized mitochondrial protein AtMg00810-like [Nymphaea colorata]|uniref:uncharacterized mitochondrial protein AtMg00810-like n=1 Tax=Nymphaea colorata TaxID=210225 RepID=UPI00129DE340|nr:uncharacterized mitochondrial protein AtMg00810-like [Nymphaea colorata]
MDFLETFSPVVKPATIRIILSVALMNGWPLKQIDVKNAFLNGYLTETVFIEKPQGFQDARFPHHVYKWNRALYGPKQAPRAWYDRFAQFLFSHNFQASSADPSLFVRLQQSTVTIRPLYVDDIILTGSSPTFLASFQNEVSRTFAMTDLGDLHYFLGIQVQHTTSSLFLNQQRYIMDILERAQMQSCRSTVTPIVTNVYSNSTVEEEAYPNATLYRSLVGALQYLTFIRPNITYAVNYVSQFMHVPSLRHFQLLKRILRYIQGTISLGMQLFKPSKLSIGAYFDADWSGCPSTHRSTTACCTFLGPNCISWASKQQQSVARSYCEAE